MNICTFPDRRLLTKARGQSSNIITIHSFANSQLSSPAHSPQSWLFHFNNTWMTSLAMTSFHFPLYGKIIWRYCIAFFCKQKRTLLSLSVLLLSFQSIVDARVYAWNEEQYFAIYLFCSLCRRSHIFSVRKFRSLWKSLRTIQHLHLDTCMGKQSRSATSLLNSANTWLNSSSRDWKGHHSTLSWRHFLFYETFSMRVASILLLAFVNSRMRWNFIRHFRVQRIRC